MSIGFLKQAINAIHNQPYSSTTHRVNQWFKWLSPGISVKRWFMVTVSGVLLAILGLAIWMKLTPIFWILELLKGLLALLTDILPHYVSGPLVLLLGGLLVLWGQSRTVGSITQVL